MRVIFIKKMLRTEVLDYCQDYKELRFLSSRTLVKPQYFPPPNLYKKKPSKHHESLRI
jgi:hypothetical protein